MIIETGGQILIGAEKWERWLHVALRARHFITSLGEVDQQSTARFRGPLNDFMIIDSAALVVDNKPINGVTRFVDYDTERNLLLLQVTPGSQYEQVLGMFRNPPHDFTQRDTIFCAAMPPEEFGIVPCAAFIVDDQRQQDSFMLPVTMRKQLQLLYLERFS